jgi:1-acyl-sn-glycerol-3-phosphate acyltransferase
MPVETLPEMLDPRDRRKYYFEMTPLRRVITAAARASFGCIGVIDASGVENLPAEGGVVLAANHLTNFDVFPMQFVLPRPIFFMAKAELHRNPLMDATMRRLGSFPVERGAKDEWAIRHAQSVLEHGLVLGIFPEGKRSKGHGLQPAKTGAARLALSTGCPILPLAVQGTDRMFSRFPRRTQVTIRIGIPLYPQPGETVLALTDRLMFTLADMLPAEVRGVYSQRPVGF